MRNRFKKNKHRESEVSTDSLNDIMFFLMLFFLILSTMISPNAMKVNLPSSTNKKPVDNSQNPIHLSVTQDRKYYIDAKEIAYSLLEDELKTKIANKKESAIVLHVDKELKYQDFIDVMQLGDRLKCKMICATQTSNGQH